MKRFHKISAGGMEFRLRLTIGGQKTLAEMFHAEPIDIIMESPEKPEYMTEVLSQCLAFKDSHNPSDVSGEDLYDLIVDDGNGGRVYFTKLCLDIAYASGIIDVKDYHRILHKLDAAVEDAYAAEDAETPTVSPENL